MARGQWIFCQASKNCYQLAWLACTLLKPNFWVHISFLLISAIEWIYIASILIEYIDIRVHEIDKHACTELNIERDVVFTFYKRASESLVRPVEFRYTFVVSRAFMGGAASQAGDADSSWAPGLTSGLQGSTVVLYCSNAHGKEELPLVRNQNLQKPDLLLHILVPIISRAVPHKMDQLRCS